MKKIDRLKELGLIGAIKRTTPMKIKLDKNSESFKEIERECNQLFEEVHQVLCKNNKSLSVCLNVLLSELMLIINSCSEDKELKQQVCDYIINQ